MKTALIPTLCAAALLLAPGALASHQFADVPNGGFHDDVARIKDANITTGCTATTFCPGSSVLRQAMAAYIVRALGLDVRPGETTRKGVPGSRVSMIDDDTSLVATVAPCLFCADGLELHHNGARALRIVGNAESPNLIGGHAVNSVTSGAQGGTVAGGGRADLMQPNRVTDSYGSVGGGLENRAGDDAGTTGDASGATVAGGILNTAAAYSATVPGGLRNVASGRASLAAGTRAIANDEGAFVWGDHSPADVYVTSPGANTFTVRAGGGVWLGTTSSPSIPAGRFLNTSTGGYLSSTGVWTDNSDRAAKTAFRRVDREELLRRLAGLPVTSWRYRQDGASVRHIGPVAQDFARAFGVGQDDRHIAALDANGVALAAIQALIEENRELRRSNAAQDRRLAALERQR